MQSTDAKISKIVKTAACFFGAMIFLTAFLPLKKTVAIYNRKNPREKIYSSAALNGFVISYTHSVNKGRVRDFYSCRNGNLVVEKTVFVSYGAGIPEPGETSGAIFGEENGGYSISNLNRSVKRLVMAVGVVAEHSFSADGKEFFLKDYFPAQTSLIFEVKKVSFADYSVHKIR